MPTFLTNYSASTSISITLENLASHTVNGRESAAVDNATTRYRDVLVSGKTKLVTGTPSGDKAIYVYAYGSELAGRFSDNATGVDAAIVLRSPTALRLVGVVPCPDAGGLTYLLGPFSLSRLFGGVLPRQWGLVVRNATGLALTGTASDHALSYTGISIGS